MTLLGEVRADVRACSKGLTSFTVENRLRRATFFAEPKKVAKERLFPDGANLLIRCRGDFSTRHPWLGRKTAHIHVRRPMGLQLSGARWGDFAATAVTAMAMAVAAMRLRANCGACGVVG